MVVIDPKALVEAFDKVSKEKLLKEVHEWIVYTAPLNVHEIYKAYLDLVEEKEKKKEIGEYSFIVQDWGVEGPRFKSEQNEWPPVGTKFVSVKG